MSAVTPTVRQPARRYLYWSLFGVAVILIAIVSMAATGANRPLGEPLAADNRGPAGAMALVEVLRQQGVTVTTAGSLAEARDAAASGTATLLLYDPDWFLDDSQLRQTAALADHTVLVDPVFHQLDVIAPEIAQAGAVGGTLEADCGVGAIERAEAVSGGGNGYRLLGETDTRNPDDTDTSNPDDTDTRVTLCLGSGDDIYSYIGLDTDDSRITVIGTTDALTNEHIAEKGNAAFALGLLGETDHLVWYRPTIADVPASESTDLGALTPRWVTGVMALLVLATIAAAVWRGRRMGPLVVENLPVTVRASETMEGRARLYQRSSARLRALDALRIGTIERLAVQCRLPRTADVDAVIAAVAAITGRPLPAVEGLLVDTLPATDRELIELSDQLLELEQAVGTAIRPA